MHQPAQAGFASCSRGVHPDGARRVPDVFLTLHQPAVSACGRGRPRTQDARGAIIPPIALSDENARALQGLPRAQGGLQPACAMSRPRRRASPWIAEGFTLQRQVFPGSSCMTSPVSGIKTPKLPLFPLWEEGAGGMLTEVVFWEVPAFLLLFWASGRPNSPFSPCGRRGQGG
jgi:hypothetical protein